MGVRLVSYKSDGEGGVGDAKAEGHSVFSIAPQLQAAFPRREVLLLIPPNRPRELARLKLALFVRTK